MSYIHIYIFVCLYLSISHFLSPWFSFSSNVLSRADPDPDPDAPPPLLPAAAAAAPPAAALSAEEATLTLGGGDLFAVAVAEDDDDDGNGNAPVPSGADRPCEPDRWWLFVITGHSTPPEGAGGGRRCLAGKLSNIQFKSIQSTEDMHLHRQLIFTFIEMGENEKTKRAGVCVVSTCSSERPGNSSAC